MKNRIQHILFHRHLLFEFLRRDLQARYVGSAMGFFWSVINPLILLAIYWVVFGLIFKAKAHLYGLDDRPGGFGFYIFCGLLPWYAFQESLIRSSTCIVDNAHLIKQVRFPAKILPAFITLSSIVNQLIGTAIFLMVLLLVDGSLPYTIIALPLIIALQALCFFGLGLLFSTLNTYIRDIAPLISIAAMILMWASPTLYSVKLLENAPQWIAWAVYANPVTYLVTIHHHLILDETWAGGASWGIFAAFSTVMFCLGYWLFTKCHQEFVDML